MSELTAPSLGPLPVPRFLASPGLGSWLEAEGISLCLSAYRSARLVLVWAVEGVVQVEQHRFGQAMGLALTGNTLFVGTPQGIWALKRSETDGAFRPKHCWLTGDVKVHDLDMDETGVPIFVNTRDNCVARPRSGGGFVPIWRPAFLAATAEEDSCHLNGLAMHDGRLLYATCLAASDEAGGWRRRAATGGLLLDAADGLPRIERLSFPHSPRIHRDELWLHESGSGWFGRGDPAAGRFERITFCPGFLRGLSFHRDWAVAGLSDRRILAAPGGQRARLPIDDALEARRCDSECGVHVIDTVRGETVHSLVLQELPELYDVRVLAGVRRPVLRLR